jgi:hypothetical protein
VDWFNFSEASPTTWAELKVAMRDRFVPPSYHRDLRKSWMCLEQGDKSVQDYYGELQKGLMHCGIVEGTEDSICRFYSGLQHDIQDIVDYKEFNTLNQLFQLDMFAEKELQGRALQGTSKVGTTYDPCSMSSSGLTRPSSFRVPPPTSKRPADAEVATHNWTSVPLLPWFWPCAEGLPKSAGIHGYRRWVHQHLRHGK